MSLGDVNKSKKFGKPTRPKEELSIFNYEGKRLSPSNDTSKFGVIPHLWEFTWSVDNFFSDSINWGAGDDVQPEAALGGYVCIVEPNDPEDRPPDESCWCVWMRADHILQQGLGPMYDTLAECQLNCTCEDEVEPEYPEDPPDDDITTESDVCIEETAVKELKINCEFNIIRDYSGDIGTQQNPDPQEPHGKGWKIRLIVHSAKWIKESNRDCHSIAQFVQDGFQQLGTSMLLIGVHARPVLGNEDNEDVLRRDGYFITRGLEVAIGYDISIKNEGGPTNCNLPCLNFMGDDDDLVFYNFCGGSKKWAKIRGEPYMTIRTPWNIEVWNLGAAMGVLNQGVGYHIAPPGWFDDQQEPRTGGGIHTYKDSMLLYTLFNLEPTTHRNASMGDALAKDITQAINFVPDVDFCVGEFLPADALDLYAHSNPRNELLEDQYFTDPDYNSLFTLINDNAPSQ